MNRMEKITRLNVGKSRPLEVLSGWQVQAYIEEKTGRAVSDQYVTKLRRDGSLQYAGLLAGTYIYTRDQVDEAIKKAEEIERMRNQFVERIN